MRAWPGLLAIVCAAGCAAPDPLTADAGATTDADVDAAPPIEPLPPPARHRWPSSGAAVRAALGGRGAWTAAWQFDDVGPMAAPGFGGMALAPQGVVQYRAAGMWDDDQAAALASVDAALVAQGEPAAGDAAGDLAGLVVVAFAEDPRGGVVATAIGRDGQGALVLAIDPQTGHLRAALGALATSLAIDHRGGGYHAVLVVVDRAAQTLTLASDLGRAPTVSIVGGWPAAFGRFTIGAGAGGPAAPARVTYAALATGDVAGLARDADEALAALRDRLAIAAPIVRPPPALPWTPPGAVRRSRRGQFWLDLDPRTLRVAATAELWVAPTGDDAAAGTAVAPLRSVHAALAATQGPTTIHLAAGDYDDARGWYGALPHDDVNLIAEGGRARLTSAVLARPWQPAVGAIGTYQSPMWARPYAVIDRAAARPWLVEVASPAEVAATAGAWTFAGGILTVHRAGDAPADGDVEVLPAATLNAQVDRAAGTLYLEGIDLDGGYKALHVRAIHRLVLVDVGLRYGASEGLGVLAGDEVLAFRVRAEANTADGFAYTATARALEVDCVGTDNGRDGSNINNGSTMHGGGTIVRVGGSYRDNQGPNLADVQGAWSWNLGTDVGGNRATQASQRINVFTDGRLWLREALVVDAAADATTDLFVAAGGVLHAFDSASASRGGGGVIDGRAD